jgi:hypothetical protein
VPTHEYDYQNIDYFVSSRRAFLEYPHSNSTAFHLHHSFRHLISEQPNMSSSISDHPYRLDGKIALVTGSGRGIGAAMAVELGRCGAKVVVNYAHSEASALKVVAEIKALGSDAIALQADIRNVSETTKLMDEAVAHYGGLDIVCSNAGVVSFGHLGEVTEVCIFSLVHAQSSISST